MLKLLKMTDQNGLFHAGFVSVYLWAAEQLYSSLAWAYDIVAWLVSFGHWSQWRLDALLFLKPGSILEVGFGTGELLIELSDRGYEVVGLELSRQMHRVTNRKFKNRGTNVMRVQGRTEKLPFAGGSFTNLVATFPSPYILRSESLKEIRRLLTQEGRVVIIGCGVRFNNRILAWLTRWWLPENCQAFVRRLSPILRQVGLKYQVVEHAAVGYVLPVVILEVNGDV